MNAIITELNKVTVSATARGNKNNRSPSNANNKGIKIPIVVNVLPKTGTMVLGTLTHMLNTLRS